MAQQYHPQFDRGNRDKHGCHTPERHHSPERHESNECCSDDKKKCLLDQILCANAKYAETYIKNGEDDSPRRHIAVIAPSDPRLDIEAAMGLCPGDAIILRNAGGRVTEDTIRSLIVAIRLQGVKEIFVVHSSNSIMQKVCDNEIRCLLKKNLGPSAPVFKQKCKKKKACHLKDLCCGTISEEWELRECCDDGKFTKNVDRYSQAEHIPFLTYTELRKSVIDDVYSIRSNVLISRCARIHGLIFNACTGRLCSVCEAEKIGKNLAKNCCVKPYRKVCPKKCSSSSSSCTVSSCSSSSSSSSCSHC